MQRQHLPEMVLAKDSDVTALNMLTHFVVAVVVPYDLSICKTKPSGEGAK